MAAGSSYPAITLTVNVANNAAASVTNTANVSGGGQTNTANDSASDATIINAGSPNVGLVKSVSPTGSQAPGTDLVYTVVYTNTGGQPARNFVMIDPNPQNIDPLERVFHNLDFKVGSITSNPGTTGLTATIEYSNDGGTTWTYTPVSGGGGAPAGYDRSVTNIRWTFTGNLSPRERWRWRARRLRPIGHEHSLDVHRQLESNLAEQYRQCELHGADSIARSQELFAETRRPPS